MVAQVLCVYFQLQLLGYVAVTATVDVTADSGK
jgi:hypothetical protein